MIRGRWVTLYGKWSVRDSQCLFKCTTFYQTLILLTCLLATFITALLPAGQPSIFSLVQDTAQFNGLYKQTLVEFNF